MRKVLSILFSISLSLSAYAMEEGATSADNIMENSAGSSALITSQSTGSDLSKNVPNVFIPSLSNVPETCAISHSGGGVVSGFGFGVGHTRVEKECSRRMYARLIAALGDPLAAKNVICSNEEVREAYKAAGNPCPPKEEKETSSRRPQRSRLK